MQAANLQLQPQTLIPGKNASAHAGIVLMKKHSDIKIVVFISAVDTDISPVRLDFYTGNTHRPGLAIYHQKGAQVVRWN